MQQSNLNLPIPKKEFQEVIEELTEYVSKASKEQFSNQDYIRKVKSLLPPILNNWLIVEVSPSVKFNPSLNRMRSILTLIRGLLMKSPQVFTNGGDFKLLGQIIFKLLPFFPEPQFKSLHSELIDTIFHFLMELVQAHDLPTYRAFFQDCIFLLSDLEEVLELFVKGKLSYDSLMVTCFSQFASQFSNLRGSSQNNDSPASSTNNENQTFDLDITQLKDISLPDQKFMSLQICITILVGKLLEKTSQFLRDFCILAQNCTPFWKILCLQIHLGPPNLQLYSLNTLYMCLLHFDFSPIIINEIISFLFLAINNNLLGKDEMIEKKLANCLKILFQSEEILSSFSFQIRELLKFSLQRSICADLKITLCECLERTLTQSGIHLIDVDIFFPFLGDFQIRKPLVRCLELALSSDTTEPSEPKRRRLNDTTKTYSTNRTTSNRYYNMLISLASELDITSSWFHQSSDYFRILHTICASITFLQLSIPLSTKDSIFTPKLKNWIQLIPNKEFFNGRWHDSTLIEILKQFYQLILYIQKYLPQFSFDESILRILTIPMKENANVELTSLYETSFFVLATLNSEIFPEKRRQIFLESLNDSRVHVKKMAVQYLPSFLKRVPVAQEFLPILQKCLDTYSTEVFECLGNSLGSICCISSGYFSNFSSKSVDNSLEAIECSICNSNDISNLKQPNVDGNLFRPFLKLLDFEPKVLCSFLTHSFLKVIKHCVFTNEEKKELGFRFIRQLIYHDNENVRKQLTLVLQGICQGNGIYFINSETLNEWFMDLKKQLVQEHNPQKQEILLNLFGHLGCVVSGEYLLCLLIDLIGNLVNNSLELRVTAYQQLLNIAKAKNCSLKNLLLNENMKEEILMYLINNLQSKPNLLDEVCLTIFEQANPLEFLRENLSFAIPRLIVDEKENLLKVLSQKLDVPLQDLIFDILDNIMYFLLVEHSDKFTVGFQVLTNILGFGLRESIKPFFSLILNRMICELGNPAKQEKVSKALSMLQRIQTGENRSNLEFIKDEFLSIIHHINTKFLDPKEELKEKEQLLASLNFLLPHINNYLNSMRHKIISSLDLAAKYPPLHDSVCNVYETFVKSLEVQHLGSILSQIFVNLVTLLTTSPQVEGKVAGIFHYLIIQNQISLQPYFRHISFVPSVSSSPSMNQIFRILQESAPKTLKELLEEMIQQIQHENLNVRIFALKKLSKELKKHQSEVNQLIKGEPVDPTIARLLKFLLVGCREPRPPARKAYGKCLGLLGAIDPARVDIIIKPQVKLHTVDVHMATELVEEYLSKAFRAARDTKAQDRAAYAIQELLAFLRCSQDATMLLSEVLPKKPTSQQKRSLEIWTRFKEETREVITPFLTSTYELKTQIVQTMTTPIYCNVRNGYREWLARWAGQLISGSKGETTPIFQACRGVVKDDIDTALYLLPHLLLNVLAGGVDVDIDNIREEMLAVLNGAAKENEHSEVNEMSTQSIFHLIDWLNKWLEASKTEKNENTRYSLKRAKSAPITNAEKLIQSIPKRTIALAAFKCHAYDRAFQAWEYHIREAIESKNKRKEVIMENFQFLEEIYCKLDEPDGFTGYAALREKVTLSEQILDFENDGKWADALSCYDIIVRNNPDKVFGLLNCLRKLGHFQTMLSVVKGGIALDSSDSFSSQLNASGVQAASLLRSWDDLESFLSKPCEPIFEVYLGRALLALKKGNKVDFKDQISKARIDVMNSLSAATLESYQRVYPFIVKLHMLEELKQGFDQVQTKLPMWNDRITATQPSYLTREPILALRRIILEQQNLDQEASNTWLEIGKVCRKGGQFQIAANCLLHSKDAPNSFIEKAALCWKQGDQYKAVMQLQEELVKRPIIVEVNNNNKNHNSHYEQEGETDFIQAKILLRLANWLQITGNVQSDDVITQYKKVTSLQPRWEKGYFHLGRYYDNMFNIIKKTEGIEKHNVKRDEYFLQAFRNYGKSLIYGHSYIFQSLPRMLTLYFDFGTFCEEHSKNPVIDFLIVLTNHSFLKKDVSSLFKRVQKDMQSFISSIPSYKWYTCFPQLVSRICHTNRQVYDCLQTLLVKVLGEFPQEALWALMSITESLTAPRATRANAVLQMAKEKGTSSELLDQAERFCSFLLNICDAPLSNSKPIAKTTLRELLKTVKSDKRSRRNVYNNGPIQMIVPLQSSLTVLLDKKGFGTEKITIQKVDENVEIMSSLQKPRKITIIGSNGEKYIFLCKPKDDLRKDCRMMEFNTMINKLLKKNPDTRRRNLYIRTYAVVPLNEECGLIEWVGNTTGYRHILQEIYKNENRADKLFEKVKQLYSKKNPINPLERYEKHLLPLFSPPVFHKFFITNFSEPSSWFEARLRYTRSLAVMSMVGYVVGLGDRHGENILLDSLNGDCVHVDFNCLFFKGTTFLKPERVPFRLTHNMVDAMGLTGYEGVFRRVCEFTLRILRMNREALMSVLETFIYDPLVEWSSGNVKKMTPGGEVENSEAVRIIQDIEERLEGKVKPLGYENSENATLVPLSVEGQVHHQIQAAVDKNNLADMYVGWAPYL